MSLRERLLVLVIVGLVGLFVLDRIVLTPVMQAWTELSESREELRVDVESAEQWIGQELDLERKWSEYRRAGLAEDASTARRRVQEHFSEWAGQTGVRIGSLSTGGDLPRDGFREVRFTTSASGEFADIVAFLQRVEESDFPLAVQRCNVTQRDSDSAQLTLSLTVSTLVVAEEDV